MAKGAKRKIYIVTDLEGISGVITFTDTGRDTNRSGPRYEAARLLLTEDVNAAVQGAIDGGATEIIVNDGHGGGDNFIMEKLHPGARYFSGGGRISVLDGLDESTDAVMLVGYHAMSGTRKAVLDHTQSSAAWHRYFLNGIEMGDRPDGGDCRPLQRACCLRNRRPGGNHRGQSPARGY